MAYENTISETRDAVGTITLNRPKALNALNAIHSMFALDDQKEGMSAFVEKAEVRFQKQIGLNRTDLSDFGNEVPQQVLNAMLERGR